MVSLLVLNLYFIVLLPRYAFYLYADLLINFSHLNVIGLSDTTLTTNAPDAGDEDVFMVNTY